MERAELRAVLCATGCAIERGEFTFLFDPTWTERERAEAEAEIAKAAWTTPDARGGWLGVRTGGSAGRVRFARHDEATLGAAVRGFCEHFALTRVNAIDVLPAHHVSGLMARVRCAATGGRHLAWDWKRLEGGEMPAITGDDWMLSLVPTQLQRLLGSPSAVGWLRRLKTIFVSGGPVWPELADAAATAKLRVSLSYGMTETAAMIAALHAEDFLAGARGGGTIMPHAQVTIEPTGVISIRGESVFRGYWPEWRDERGFTSEDLGRIDERGRLHVIGRRDTMIISGGRKVNPADVEAALRASGEFVDVAVLGLPDPEWGEIVVACYPADEFPPPNLEQAVERLPSFQRPKRFVRVAHWPRNAQGKVNRAALRDAVEQSR